MKKILFVNRHNLSITGGIEMHISHLVKFLMDKYNVTVLSYNDSVQLPNNNFSQEAGLFGFLKYKYQNYNVILIENFNILPHFVVILKLLLLKIIGKNTYKVIFVPHGGFIPYWEMFPPVSRLIKKIYHKIIGVCFVKYIADDIVVVSEWEKNALIKVGVKKDVHLIGNGMDSVDFNLHDIKKENYFIFIGRVDPIKDIFKILQTFYEIKKNKKFKNYKLYIVGPYNVNDEYYKELIKLISVLGLVDSVKFVGAKYGKDKYNLLTRAQCLFCMSKFETDPIVIKEAFSVNTKVCITPNYGLSDYVDEDNVFTVVNDDINTDKFFLFVNAGFITSTKKQLTWDKVAQKYEELF